MIQMAEQIIQIDENTWRLEDGFVRFFLLKGAKEALLIDSGVGSPDAKAIAESLTNLPVKLINTHGDGDHTSGNSGFSSYMIHPADYKNYAMADHYPGCTPVSIQDGEVIDLGDRPLEILFTPGHTYGSISVLDVQNRVLYPGDTVQDDNVFLFGPTRAPELYADSLKKLAELSHRYDKVFPCHGTPCLDADAVQKVLEDWNGVLSHRIAPVVQEVFGFKAAVCKGSFCGFFCEP